MLISEYCLECGFPEEDCICGELDAILCVDILKRRGIL